MPGGSGLPACKAASKRAQAVTRHSEACRAHGDPAWQSQNALITSQAPKARSFTNERSRAFFAMLNRRWGFTKVRDRCPQKNATRTFTALAPI